MANLGLQNNNPGNLRNPQTGGFQKFNNPDEGYNKLVQDLAIKQSGKSSVIKPGASIEQLGNVWAPPSDNNIPGAWAKNVAKTVGVDTNTPFDKIPVDKLAKGVQVAEGTSSMKTNSLPDTLSADEVKQMSGSTQDTGLPDILPADEVKSLGGQADVPAPDTSHNNDIKVGGKTIVGGYLGGLLKNIGGQVKGNVQEASNSLTQSSEGKMNPFEAGANIAKNATDAVLSPISQTIGKALGAVTNPAVEAINNSAPVQKITDALSKHPSISGTAGDILGTGLNVASMGIGEEAPGAVKSGIETAKNTTRAVLPDSPTLMNKVARVNPTDAAKFKVMSGGDDIGTFLDKRGLHGSTEDVISKTYSRFLQSKDVVDTTFDKIPGNFKNPAVTTALTDLVEREKSISPQGVPSPDLVRSQELLEKSQGNGLTMKEINESKRLYERNVKTDYIKENKLTAVARATNIDSHIRDFQAKLASERGFKNVPELNKETQLNRFITDKLGKKYDGQLGNNGISLSDWMVASQVAAHPAAIFELLGKKLFSSSKMIGKAAGILSKENQIGIPSADYKANNPLQLPAGDLRYRGDQTTIKAYPPNSVEPPAKMINREPSPVRKLPVLSKDKLVKVKINKGNNYYPNDLPSIDMGTTPKTKNKLPIIR